MKRYYVFIAFLIVVTVAAALAQTELGKGVKADKKLGDSLSSFNSKIQNYATSHNALPTAAQAGGAPAGVTYTILTSTTYKLCGTFTTANKDPNYSDSGLTQNTFYIDTTHHDKGYVCFNASVTIQPPVVQPKGTPRPIETHPSISPATKVN